MWAKENPGMIDSRQADQYPFTPQQLEAVFAPLVGACSLRICEVVAGNINTIVKVDIDGRSYGLRVRTHEQVYRYEPDLVKEAFVTWLLTHTGSIKDDGEIAAAFSALCAARCGHIASSPEVLPALLYYDWSRSRLAHPYCLYRWVDGVPLWSSPQARLYALAGQQLAKIHRVTFSAFYTDF